MNLIQAQESHIERILNATPYSTNKSYLCRPHTVLNVKVITLRSSRRKFRDDMAKLGFDAKSVAVNLAMKDAEDMAELEAFAE